MREIAIMRLPAREAGPSDGLCLESRLGDEVLELPGLQTSQ
jgi:hypothetical protein